MKTSYNHTDRQNGKDDRYIKTGSLLNVHYKIATKVLATGMKTVLPNIMHHSQSGYVDGRFIGEAVRTTASMIDHTKFKNVKGILIDFEKAFDSFEKTFLQKALELSNYGSLFRKWVKPSIVTLAVV